MIYEFSKYSYSRSEAWNELWGFWCKSDKFNPERNPFRKCHGRDVWRYEGPVLTFSDPEAAERGSDFIALTRPIRD